MVSPDILQLCRCLKDITTCQSRHWAFDFREITYKVVPNPRAKCTYACIASTLRLRESVRLAAMSKFGYEVYSKTPFLVRVRSPFVRTAAEHGIPNVQATATWTKSAMGDQVVHVSESGVVQDLTESMTTLNRGGTATSCVPVMT
ncbi:predicted protein [Histoplasma capsulatum G186AR]|uniref:Uncharacterized protein n=1 Tax=Ajellomyces capsulatus (strain G186AR / H82 / ATCC MYA-2454 / RMSCC 2432) TaxID=447093 RepID=C0P0M0_AJECG|nr:uncharacterized protein HCBG_08950 [Histoplasma capsulatum G186AR]EEH02840.1 predicted protein [Histoplasma capsulatum G186AR]